MSYSLCRVIRFKIYHISLESSRFRIFVCQRAKIPKQSTEGEERLKVAGIKAEVKRGERDLGKATTRAFHSAIYRRRFTRRIDRPSNERSSRIAFKFISLPEK